jgi:hypothetical protein
MSEDSFAKLRAAGAAKYFFSNRLEQRWRRPVGMAGKPRELTLGFSIGNCMMEQLGRLPFGRHLMDRRLSLIAFVVIAQFTLLAQIGPSFADKRIALVVGNSHYANAPALNNPANDASDVANALTAIGFEVTLKLDANKREMDQAVAQYARGSAKADATLFYYAGHGMQYQGRNYITPVDADLEDEISLKYELTSIDDVKDALLQSKGVKIMVLDACRTNPLVEKLARSIHASTRDVPKMRGYAPIERTNGMVVVFATQADEVANDGIGRNSPFSSAFIKEVKEPGLEIGALFRRVNADVYATTDGQQSPEISISLLSDYYLNESETDQQVWARIRTSPEPSALREFIDHYPKSFYAPDAAALLGLLEREPREKETADQAAKRNQEAPAAAPAGASPPPAGDRQAAENLLWKSAQQSNAVAEYQAYLDAFPSGVFAPLARHRIAAMTPKAVATSALPESAIPPTDSIAKLKSEVGTQETEKALNLGVSERKELQQRLAALNLNPGPADGDFGEKARLAVKEWQNRHALTPSGFLGPLEYAALKSESEAPYRRSLAAAPQPVDADATLASFSIIPAHTLATGAKIVVTTPSGRKMTCIGGNGDREPRRCTWN